MTNGTELTPQTGTDSMNPTPDTGTVIGQATDGESIAPPAETVDYKAKFSESTREAQRLYQENQRLQGQLWAYYNQPKPANPPPAVESQNADSQMDPSLYTNLADAVINRDPEPIKKFAETIRKQTVSDIMHVATQATAENQKQVRIQSSVQKIQREFGTDQALFQEAWKSYNEMASDPGESAVVQQDFIAVGNMQINPHLMVRAIDRARSKIGGMTASVSAAARESAEHFTEPARATKGPPQKNFDPQKHLSDAERAYCNRAGVTYERYWKYLDDPKKGVSIKEERIKRGQPVTYKQLGM